MHCNQSFIWTDVIFCRPPIHQLISLWWTVRITPQQWPLLPSFSEGTEFEFWTVVSAIPMQGLVSYKTEHFFFSSSFSIDRLIDSSTRNQNPTPGVFDCNREMVKGQLQYEEIRKQRLEENKKKLEDLNLTHLLHTVRNASPKSSPVRHPPFFYVF